MMSTKSTSKKSRPQNIGFATQDFASLLWNTSTKIFLDNQESFLRKFNTTFFGNKELIADIEKALATGTPIGQPSAMGTNKLITTNEGNQYVVKTSVMCPVDIKTNSKYNVYHTTLCNEAELGDVIFRVPSTFDKKQILLAPNYFTESLIGILLYSNKMKKYTPSFPKVYGFQYNSKDPLKKVYTVMEPLKPIIPLLDSELKIIYFIFQVANGLNAAQKIGRYVHNDLHAGNVMSKPKDKNVVYAYELNNGNYMYTMFDFETKFIDFGMNRMETKEEVIIPKVNFSLGVQNKPDLFNFYEFNPYCDLFSIINFVLYGASNHSPKLPFVNERGRFLVIRDLLMSSFLGIENNSDVISHHITRILFPNSWRPDPSSISAFDPTNDIRPPHTPEIYMSVLADIVTKTIRKAYPKLNTSSPDEIVNVLKNAQMIVLDELLDLSGVGNVKSVVVYPMISKKDSMDTTYYPTMISEKDVTMGCVQIKSFQQHQQYIHVATIDQNRGISEEGYKFRFDCCRVDIRNFLRSQNIKNGVAINASFFQIKSNYSPIGYFRTPDMTVNNPIPFIYKSSYGMVGIYKDGKLGIKSAASDIVPDFDQVLTVGPIILWDGLMIREEELNVIEENIAKYKCVKTPDGRDKNDKYFVDNNGRKIPNCDKISPGELSHSGTPNPRSALALNTNTNTVYFVYVEGRNLRGKGVDLIQLSDICKKLGATRAINLDGGGSSQLVWRAPGESVINQTNPTHDFAYPVGNIISFIKEK
jgi:serine/threonine protein kinase